MAAPAKAAGRAGAVLEALFAPLSRSDARRWSERLLHRFGSLGGVLTASPEAIGRAVGDERPIELLRASRALQQHLSETAIDDRPLLSSLEQLMRYLRATLAHQSRESARALYLDAGNRLVRDEVCATGSPSEVVLQPREILRRALELDATALILAHNHPSGLAAPSESDIAATRQLAAAARAVDVVLHDHFIVTAQGCLSLRAMGVLR